MAGNYVINRKKRCTVTKKRRMVQQSKRNHGIEAPAVLEALNASIVPIEKLVFDATERRKASLLLKDVPHDAVVRTKIVSAVRPGFMAKHGVMVQPTRINKKKVKKMLQKKVSCSIIQKLYGAE